MKDSVRLCGRAIVICLVTLLTIGAGALPSALADDIQVDGEYVAPDPNSLPSPEAAVQSLVWDLQSQDVAAPAFEHGGELCELVGCFGEQPENDSPDSVWIPGAGEWSGCGVAARMQRVGHGYYKAIGTMKCTDPLKRGAIQVCMQKKTGWWAWQWADEWCQYWHVRAQESSLEDSITVYVGRRNYVRAKVYYEAEPNPPFQGSRSGAATSKPMKVDPADMP